jgi:drug/metabolite transporter (DMT)-like permease
MKWMFLFSLLIALPFSGKELSMVSYTTLPVQYILELMYLIIFSTFIAYFLIPLSQKKIRPTLVGMYSYVQPIIATIMSIYLGLDTLSYPKILAAIAVIAGVVIVNKRDHRKISVGKI